MRLDTNRGQKALEAKETKRKEKLEKIKERKDLELKRKENGKKTKA